MPRIRRSFSAEFKAQIVLQYLSGEASPAELCRKHHLKPNLIANWKAAVLDRGSPDTSAWCNAINPSCLPPVTCLGREYHSRQLLLVRF
ncbi:MAG: hypothetical protein EXS09_03570 [Gemmataceae bacterium]|nr:hypothetical protein [Gemmataceae bacterium]